MEWNMEYERFEFNLDRGMSCIAPEAPMQMKETARMLNASDMQVNQYKTYAGLDFNAENFMRLKPLFSS